MRKRQASTSVVDTTACVSMTVLPSLPAYGSPPLTACVWQSSPHLRAASGPAAMLITDKTSEQPLNLCYGASKGPREGV